MRLDQGSLLLKRKTGQGASWESSLGTGKNYFFVTPGYENIITGILYNSIPLKDISNIFGKEKANVSGDDPSQNPEQQAVQLAGIFNKVVVHYNDRSEPFDNAPIILLVTQVQDPQKRHYGKRSIKYSVNTAYKKTENETIINQASFDTIQEKFDDRLTCYGMLVEQFETLHLYCVNADTGYDLSEWLSLPMPDITCMSGAFADSSFEQIIYYGTPGCGKSHTIKKKLEGFSEYNVIRTVFHPEYTNADFVGQILPEVRDSDDKTHSIVEYKFKPGPFAEIIRRAYQNPGKPFYLVIEEINRGNAAAIFGEMFQLLDRIGMSENDPSTENVYGPGWSSYGVDNKDINAYIRNVNMIEYDAVNNFCTAVKNRNDHEENALFFDHIEIKDAKVNVEYHSQGTKKKAEKIERDTLHFSANTAIRLPPNLSIYATMNTSDQNVFTLDNAFQRRFEMELVKDDLNKSSAQYNMRIEGTDICWGDFRNWINGKIIQIFANSSNLEDKRLGSWFISGKKKHNDNKFEIEELENYPRKLFGEKVIKYLWDDVFKRHAERNKIFKQLDTTKPNLLSTLINEFVRDDQNLDPFKRIFILDDSDNPRLK